MSTQRVKSGNDAAQSAARALDRILIRLALISPLALLILLLSGTARQQSALMIIAGVGIASFWALLDLRS